LLHPFARALTPYHANYPAKGKRNIKNNKKLNQTL